MRSLLGLLMVALVAGSRQRYSKSAWEAWKAEYEKSYESEEEDARRYAAWQENTRYLHHHDAGHTLGPNEFMDMVSEEEDARRYAAWQENTRYLHHHDAGHTLGPNEFMDMVSEEEDARRYAAWQENTRYLHHHDAGHTLGPNEFMDMVSEEEDARRYAAWQENTRYLHHHDAGHTLGPNEFMDMVSEEEDARRYAAWQENTRYLHHHDAGHTLGPNEFMDMVSEEEDARRYAAWQENTRYLHHHDAGHTLGLGPNEFMDMTIKEFRNTMNGFRPRFGDSLAKGHGATFLPPHNVQIPASADWRKHGYVSHVKNQGHCGSCWAFSSTGSLEGQTYRKTGKMTILSEQNLIDCSKSFGNNGCEGGLMDQAFQYIKANDGLDTEKSYPYEARDDKCRFKSRNVGAEDTGFVDVKPHGNETALKIAVATVGPVSVAIDASHQSFMMYKGGVYNEPECSSEQLDHGVLVVGYGTSDEGDDYWIVKNSWGPSWGERGYVRMARNNDNMCGIASQASYPLV